MAAPQKPKLTCLYLSSFPAGQGDYQTACAMLADVLRDQGYELHTASPFKNIFAKFLHMAGVYCRRFFRFRVLIIDVFSSLAFWYAVFFAFLGRLTGKKVVLILHGGNLPEKADNAPFWMRFLFRQAHAVTAPSAFLRDEMMQRFPVCVSVIHNALEVELYPGRVREPAEPVLFWLRAFKAFYQPEYAVEVVHRLRDRFPAVELHMAGPIVDDSYQKCRQLVAAYNLENRVHFHGLIDKPTIRELGNRCDVFLNTTSIDNAPVTVLEALFMGLCVVSSAVGGVPKLVKAGDEALLVPADKVDGFVDAVTRILTEPQTASALSKAGLAKAEAFSKASVGAEWDKLLRTL